MGALTRFVQMALQSLVLGFGALLVIEGKMSGGMMIAASILVGRAGAGAAGDRRLERLQHRAQQLGSPVRPAASASAARERHGLA
ncbi:hypothetical protein LP419_26645 [Massilia sp. H-1]|nr:hypothetical protein LP419_26645 [Massilia sp. H-1]